MRWDMVRTHPPDGETPVCTHEFLCCTAIKRYYSGPHLGLHICIHLRQSK